MLYFTMICSFLAFVALDQNSVKKSIDLYREQLQKAPKDQKGELSFKLAIAYLNDQDQENAFKEFLTALEAVAPKSAPPVTDQERELYEKGYSMYLDRHPSNSPKDTALKLYLELKQSADDHKEFHLLNLLMSTVYANLERYEEFFNVFYHSYPYYSDHYLSYKTKAALHIKLFEKARTLNEREGERKLVVQNIENAINRNALDIGLYKVAMIFAAVEDQAKTVEGYLSQIIEKNIMVSRNDIAFFVDQAISSKQLDLAQKFVDKSREWYQYSRSIAEAQEQIDQHR